MAFSQPGEKKICARSLGMRSCASSVSLDVFEEALPIFDGWPDVPCAYLQFGSNQSMSLSPSNLYGWVCLCQAGEKSFPYSHRPATGCTGAPGLERVAGRLNPVLRAGQAGLHHLALQTRPPPQLHEQLFEPLRLQTSSKSAAIEAIDQGS
jgi:hypothetical protein